MLATSSGISAYWNGAYRSGAAAISFGSKKYTNIVMRFRFPYVNVFIDGVLSSTGYTTTYPAASSSPLHIGEYDFTINRSIKADFSSVYIYERAINNAEVKQLYVDSLAPFRRKAKPIGYQPNKELIGLFRT
jgi:hypothetical protein